jgi:hypothetical protein
MPLPILKKLPAVRCRAGLRNVFSDPAGGRWKILAKHLHVVNDYPHAASPHSRDVIARWAIYPKRFSCMEVGAIT